MREIINGLLELIFPSRCRICGSSSQDPICATCFASFPRINRQNSTTGTATDSARVDCDFDKVRSGGLYSGALKEAIRILKYKNGRRLAPQLADFISESTSDLMADLDAVAYVPLSPSKEARRGYNQSKLIAKELARIFGKPLYTGLAKTKPVAEQNKLGLSERAQNVKGAFCARVPIPGLAIGLVDDVFTTGSTTSECALELKKAGASKVYVLTVAKTPLEGR